MFDDRVASTEIHGDDRIERRQSVGRGDLAPFGNTGVVHNNIYFFKLFLNGSSQFDDAGIT